MNQDKNIDRISARPTPSSAVGIRIIATILLLLVHGCGLQNRAPFPGSKYPQDPAPGEQVLIEPPGEGPGHTLYTEAQQLLAQGNNHQAELALERALRIEPGNPAYWYAMGKTKYRQNQYAQAIQFCLKSKSLAGNNARLIRMNDQLILEARRAGGV
ncbi:tetratricopeptide repeat protein [Desulfopila inferna]|uniref:tetratricopeptide repeat protein n=1 Tax=Desulfopila inferna TaxID=468528 RepID=UPI001963EE77|nr:tetratricopeptide repeat protein [Desulfopila inferna]MBM9606621.1 tetratricopeptide repeat protein [Desulfopila inferna]